MIKQVTTDEELSGLPLTGIAPQKIRALWRAYGSACSFCRIYSQEGRAFVSLLDSSAVVWTADGADFSELVPFLGMNGFSELFCGAQTARGIMRGLSASCTESLLMRFDGAPKPSAADYSPSLEDVYRIVGAAFDIEFEPWYLDLSHRVRHGVSAAVLSQHSALVIQHCANGEALLSMVATDPFHRGQGSASRLILEVCAHLAPNKVYVLCEERLRGFYERLGFVKISTQCVLRCV